jgi:hypothetical protein
MFRALLTIFYKKCLDNQFYMLNRSCRTIFIEVNIGPAYVPV